MIRVRRPIILGWPARLRLLLSRRRPVLRLPIRARHRYRGTESQHAQPSTALESNFHFKASEFKIARAYIDRLLSGSSASSPCTGCGRSVSGSKFAKTS